MDEISRQKYSNTKWETQEILQQNSICFRWSGSGSDVKIFFSNRKELQEGLEDALWGIAQIKEKLGETK